MWWQHHDRRFRAMLAILSGCLAMLAIPPGQMHAADEPSSGPGHRIACADYSQGKVFIVSADGRVEWEHDAPGCDDVTVLPSGNLLFAVRTGVVEVTPAKEVVFRVQVRKRNLRVPEITGWRHLRG